MLSFFRIQSFRARLILLAVGSSLLAASVVGATLVAQTYQRLRAAAEENLLTQADIIAVHSEAVLSFDDPSSANETLEALRVIPEVGGAWIYQSDGTLFAHYSPAQNPSPVFLPGRAGERQDGRWVVRTKPIIQQNERLGTLVMSYDTQPLISRVRSNVVVSLGLAALAAVFGLGLAWRLQRIVTRPIDELADVAREVSRTGNFGIRARKYADDELGRLTDVINQMLIRIEQQAREIQIGNERFRVAVEAAPNAMVKVDADGTIILINQQTEKMFGYSREELIGQSVEILVPDRYRQNHPGFREMFFKEPKARPMGAGRELFGRHKDGREFPIEIGLNPIQTGEGLRVLSSIVDITERKRQDEALHQSERELADFFENASLGLHWVGPDGTILRVNKAELEMLGYTAEEYIGHHIAEFHVHKPVIDDILNRLAQGETLHNYSAQMRCKDGSIRHVLIDSSVLWDEHGQFVHTRCFTRDVTEQKLAEEALRESQERLAMAQAAGHVGTFDWNMQTGRVIWSAELESLFGLAPGQFGETYETWKAFVHPDDREATERAMLDSIRQHKDFVCEYRVIWPDQAVHWILATARTIYDPAGQPIRMLGVNVDITERKRGEEERATLLESERAARSDAERASRMKDEFVATLSHELRTPMTAILGWAQMLRRDGKQPEEIGQGLEVIERNARVQSQIIEDLLDMSRIISGKVRLDVQSVDLSEVIDAAIATVRPAAEAKEIKLQSIQDPRIGPVRGDPSRLQQVVWNLLSNAIKFTPRHGRVQVSLVRVNSHIEIIVSDTGQGIDPEFLPYVFERFRQADASTTRRQGGLGLGLAIVKQLVELHGGTVAVTSPGKDQGSTFTVKLPLAIVHSAFPVEDRIHPRQLKHTAEASAPSLKGTNVLIVEDEPDARELIARLLEQHDASVMRSSSAMEALEVLEHFKPHVLVSDIGMPDHDGYEFIRRVRALSASRGGATPAVALTAFARSEDRTRALLAGYQMHVAKPVEPAELVAAIASVVGLRGRADRAEPLQRS